MLRMSVSIPSEKAGDCRERYVSCVMPTMVEGVLSDNAVTRRMGPKPHCPAAGGADKPVRQRGRSVRGRPLMLRRSGDPGNDGADPQFSVASNSMMLRSPSVVGATMIFALAIPGPENSIDRPIMSSAPWLTG